MYTTSLSAAIAYQHQFDMRATAQRRSLANLFRRPMVEAPRRSPTYGGITAVPATAAPAEQAGVQVPRPRRDHAAHAA